MMGKVRIYAMLLIITVAGSSWGFLVHRTVHQLAVYELPPPMQHFFYRNMDYLIRHSVRPDLRRNEDTAEATRHFINLEAFGDSAAWKMPVEWDAALGLYGRDSLIKYGYVPYYVIMMKERLTRAFRNGQQDSVLFLATDLAHYIGDAHVPLHTTTNYDGQLTGQRGMHSLWESMIPEMELAQYRLSSRHKARYLRHPEQAIWKAVRNAHQLLDEMLEQEKAVSLLLGDSAKYRIQVRNGREYKSYSGAFAKAYSKRLGKSINKQLISSANLVADFWYTSWVDAGKPDMEQWLQSPWDKDDKERWRTEVKAFRHNELLDKKLLISRQEESSE